MTVSLDRMNTQPIAKTTIKKHLDRLQFLMSMFQKPIEWIMKNPSHVMRVMISKSYEDATLAGYATSVSKLYSIHPSFMKTNKDPYMEWVSHMKHYGAKRMEKYERNELTDRQVKNIVTFNDMKKRFCEMQSLPEYQTNIKRNYDYILFALFLNIKPKRADLGNVYVSLDGRIPKSYIKRNYIVLNGDDNRLVLNEYKTAKYYKTITEPLNDTLVDVLKESMDLYPRSHLFVSLSGKTKGLPYTKNNSYGKFVTRVFEKHFDCSMGVSLWRRVYIGEHVDFNVDTYSEMKKNAILSGHSVETQLKVYKTHGTNYPITRRSRDEIGKPVTCS